MFAFKCPESCTLSPTRGSDFPMYNVSKVGLVYFILLFKFLDSIQINNQLNCHVRFYCYMPALLLPKLVKEA